MTEHSIRKVQHSPNSYSIKHLPHSNLFAPKEAPLRQSPKPANDQFLLLPDEYCFAEDLDAMFDVDAEKNGFYLFPGSGLITRTRAKIFLTGQRVCAPPAMKPSLIRS